MIRSSYTCPDCPRRNFKSGRGLTQHRNAKHRDLSPASDLENDASASTKHLHRFLNGQSPSLHNGQDLPPGTAPSFDPTSHMNINADGANAWHPFESRKDFDFAHYHFVEVQSSEAEINKALDMWAAQVCEFGVEPPWCVTNELYDTIDKIQAGDAPWKVYKIRYTGPLPPGTPPKWMTETYDLCTRDTRQVLQNQLMAPEFKGAMNLAPYRQFNQSGHRIWSNLMSADWAWKQADQISADESTHGAMFVPIIAGSDKTTVSVATGHQEYHPVYMSPGNLTNTARRAHGNGVLPVAFLPIPKTTRKHRGTAGYQTFCRQMYHAALARVFEPLRTGMTTPEVVRCADGHFRRAIYGIGPYIADYPEQVWLSGIVQGWCPKCDARPENLDARNTLPRSRHKTQFLIRSFASSVLWSNFGVRANIIPFTHRFPRADIHELLSPDLLHQVIKGTFKDHIVTWVNEYLHLEHGETRANAIIDDIDRRISAVPVFPGLRRFPDGRDFSQWTGDDSKALMKVYLAAIVGHVPPAMVKCLAAFLDFCYLARRNAISSETLQQLEAALARFHRHRQIFINTGVRENTISLPRQHSLKHYPRSIRLFGSPNGLCSSITESKHIKAVKEPWRRSSRFHALVQMLRTNCRLDKMAAARQAFTARGMMAGTTLSYTLRTLDGEEPQPPIQPAEPTEEDDEGGPMVGPKVLSSIELSQTPQRGYPKNVEDLATHINQPRLPELIRRFLYDQINPDAPISSADVTLEQCPNFSGRIAVFHSAIARFYAPSDLCGAGGMRREYIRSNPSWRGDYVRRDTVFITTHSEDEGMYGMVVGRVYLFFSFSFCDSIYPCALVHWFVPIGGEADDQTGMWAVKPEFTAPGRRSLAVVHLDSIARAAHLLPVYGSAFLPEDLHFSQSLDAFRAFYVNRYSDHHMHEFLA
ncbi:hypothetical protein BJ138DRAFT_1016682 [Hygrophoropsis aurantiaca]|uniref:Uncharacterized protein n=1 Tax=Hygrophoropsis aurantiaca TaxID=72124 RepID=A0ACB7ZZ49_9AGAM|nr:hypothetical protein BJ138DRAFT_1016682 [Hygrophoropsis aurantiaca]